MILFYTIATEQTPSLGQVFAWFISIVSAALSYLAWRFIKSYDDKISNLEKDIVSLKKVVDDLKADNSQLRIEASNRLIQYIEKLNVTNIKLAEIKTILKNEDEEYS